MRLLTDRGFILTILVVVVFATILAFGLGASAELIGTILGLGVVTAVAENMMRAKKIAGNARFALKSARIAASPGAFCREPFSLAAIQSGKEGQRGDRHGAIAKPARRCRSCRAG